MNLTEIADAATALLVNDYGSRPRGEAARHTITSTLAEHGMAHNWTNYSPAIDGIGHATDTQKWVLNHAHDLPEAVAHLCEVVAAAWTHDKDDGKMLDRWNETQIRDLVDRAVARYVRGALGEMAAMERIRGRVVEENVNDESEGVDIRTEDGTTYQVKTVFPGGDPDFDKKNADYLMTVEMTGEGEVEDVKKRLAEKA